MRNPFEIMKQVEEAYFLPKGTLTSAKRSQAVSEARHVAIHLVRKTNRQYSLSEIADIFLIDRTCVQYALRRIRGTKNPDILELIEKNV